ncbi:MAG TPA: response regulator transcription factor [Caldilinea sp.]|nr:response regulator transcription factor [Anaerolineales bacterium]HRA66723.1 response regulator transcription factor [Caldilinea sp.]
MIISAVSKQRILVVDDDKSIVNVVRGYLEQAGYLVLAAYNGEDALHALRSEKPDLLVLDLMLPDRDGWEITRLIRADASLGVMPIIMLTARVEDVDKIIGLEIGADDYITKPFNAREIVARVRALMRRVQFGQFAPSQQVRVGALVLDIDRRVIFLDDRLIELTRTEFTLLQLLMSHAGYTFTRDELLEKIMGYAYEGMGRTLDTHISNLRKKIEPDPSAPTYIQTVYGVGYRMTRAG